MEILPSRQPPRPLTDDERRIAQTILDPVEFSRHWLKADIWPTQAELMRSVATRPRTGCKACHSSGKTFCAACLALWWLTRYPDGIVITTAPGWSQVEKIIWRQIHTLIAQARVRFPEPKLTELYKDSENYVLGLSTNEGVRFQGFHGRVLIIIDEAPGISPEIFEAIDGIRAGGDVRVLMLGNPTIASGPFYDAFTTNREVWGEGLFTIDAFDTPNLEGVTLEQLLEMSDEELAIAPRPELTTRAWVKERFKELKGTVTVDEDGKKVITEPVDPAWEARVRGKFPRRGENALYWLDWLEAAQTASPIDSGGMLRAGVDVAGPGEDETTLAIVDPFTGSILRQYWWPEYDPRGALLAELEPFKNRLEVVNVDSVGIGYYLALHLQDHDIPVQKVNVARASIQPRRFRDLKAEYYWALRMLLERGLRGLKDNTTVAQLQSILYRYNAKGQVEIESKKEAREKRGVKSPDRAESIVLAFADAMGTIGMIDPPPAPGRDEEKGPYQNQLEAAVPAVAEFARYTAEKQETCATCTAFRMVPKQDAVGRCSIQGFMTPKDAPQCPHYWPKDEE